MGIELETLALADLIPRSEALNATVRAMDKFYGEGLLLRDQCLFSALNKVSAVAPTLNGYELKQLVLITKIMAAEGISPEDAVRAFNDIGKMVQIIQKEQERAFQEALEGAMDGLKTE